MKDFQSTESKEIPETQTAALQGSFRFPVVDCPFAKYVLTHSHLSYQNISGESCITTREFCCRSHHPHSDSCFTLCTALPFLFTICCWQQTHEPMVRALLQQQQQQQPPFCAALLFCKGRPPPGSRRECVLQLAEARMDVMDHCSDVSAPMAALSHRARAGPGHRSRGLRSLLPPGPNLSWRREELRDSPKRQISSSRSVLMSAWAVAGYGCFCSRRFLVQEPSPLLNGRACAAH